MMMDGDDDGRCMIDDGAAQPWVRPAGVRLLWASCWGRGARGE
jgi:hypothetical protein